MVLFFSVLLEARAQTYLEVRGGYTLNLPNQDFRSSTFEDMEAPGGSYVTVVITHYVTKTLLFKFGSEWVQKKYLLRRASPFNAIYKQINNRYLQLPVSVGLRLISTKKIRFTMSSGVFGGYWLSSATKGTIPNAFDTFNTAENGEVIQNFRVSEYSMKNDLDRGNYARFEFGLLLEASAAYAINSTWSLSTHISYQQALTSRQKQSSANETSIANKTMIASAGVMYKLQ